MEAAAQLLTSASKKRKRQQESDDLINNVLLVDTDSRFENKYRELEEVHRDPLLQDVKSINVRARFFDEDWHFLVKFQAPENHPRWFPWSVTPPNFVKAKLFSAFSLPLDARSSAGHCHAWISLCHMTKFFCIEQVCREALCPR